MIRNSIGRGLLSVLAALPLAGQATERKDVPEQYRWDLHDLYADEQAWLAPGILTARSR